MPAFAQTLNPTFTIDQLASHYLTAFDAVGFGTGKVNIQGGYRFTAQQATDTLAAPVAVYPDGTVSAPASITNLLGCDWVDNGNGKNLVYPSGPLGGGNTRALLLMYLPGVRRVRLKFTVVARVSGSGALANGDLDMIYHDLRINANPSPIDNNHTRTADLKPAGTFNIGQQYTSNWSNDGAAGNECQINPTISIGIRNAVLRIDAVEYEVMANKFGVQSPGLDSPLFEFGFYNVSGVGYGVCNSFPLKNAWRPRVLLTLNDTQGNSSPFLTSAHTQWPRLFNDWRTDNLSEAGLMEYQRVVNWAARNVAYGTALTLNLWANADYGGFFLRATQAGKADTQIVVDRIDKSKSFPALAVVVPERRVTVNGADGSRGTTSAVTNPLNLMQAFEVRGSAKRLRQVVKPAPGANPANPMFKLYRLSRDAQGRLFYDSLAAGPVAMSLSGSSQSVQATASNLDLELPPGLYGLAFSFGNDGAASDIGSSVNRGQNTSQVRFLGGVLCPADAYNTAWAPGQRMNLGADNLPAAQLNFADCNDIGLVFDNNPTPDATVKAHAEGWAIHTANPYDGQQYQTIHLYQPAAPGSWSGANSTVSFPGMVLPFCADLDISDYRLTHYILSLLPGFYTALGVLGSANAFLQPRIDFSAAYQDGVYDAWLDYPTRTSLALRTVKWRSQTGVAEGGAFVNGDGSQDVVFCKPSNRSNTLCWRYVP